MLGKNKRHEIFYVRVKPENKALFVDNAKELDASESVYADCVFDLLRTSEAGKAILDAVAKEANLDQIPVEVPFKATKKR